MHGLPISQCAKFTSKTITQHLLGSRNSYNVFKYENLKHLLLKLTPFIGTVFASHLKLKTQISRKIRKKLPIPPKDPLKVPSWKNKIRNKKFNFKQKIYFYEPAEKKKPIIILFATITPLYSTIIQKAAQLCQMPFYSKRWWGGYLTANFISLKPLKKHKKLIFAQKTGINLSSEIFKLEPTKLWKKLLPVDSRVNSLELWKQFNKKKIRFYRSEELFEHKFKVNKEKWEKYYDWHRSQRKAKRPALAIIPDIQANVMILKETISLKIPVIGLVDSTCNLKIDYPIFGTSTSIKIVNFFSNFIATIIAKEFIEQIFKNKSHRIFSKKLWISPIWSKLKVKQISLKKRRKIPVIKKKAKIYKSQMSLYLYKKLKRKFKSHFKSIFNKYQKSLVKKKKRFKRKNRIKNRRWLKPRKRFNISLGNLVEPQNNLKNTIYESVFNPIYVRKNYFSRSILTSLLRLERENNKKKMNLFFIRYFYLNFLTRNFFKNKSDYHQLNSAQYFFFERKKKNSIPFLWKIIENELNFITAAAWANSYWIFFWNNQKNKQKKKNKIKKLWWRKKSRKFKIRSRRKIKFLRSNQQFNWLWSKKLWLNNRIRLLTTLWLNTQHNSIDVMSITTFKRIDTFWNKKFRKRFWFKNKIRFVYSYLKKKHYIRWKSLRWRKYKKYKWKSKLKKKYKNFSKTKKTTTRF